VAGTLVVGTLVVGTLVVGTLVVGTLVVGTLVLGTVGPVAVGPVAVGLVAVGLVAVPPCCYESIRCIVGLGFHSDQSSPIFHNTRRFFLYILLEIRCSYSSLHWI
jgi:hypothetical protein